MINPGILLNNKINKLISDLPDNYKKGAMAIIKKAKEGELKTEDVIKFAGSVKGVDGIVEELEKNNKLVEEKKKNLKDQINKMK